MEKILNAVNELVQKERQELHKELVELFDYEMDAVEFELDKAFEEIEGLNHVIEEHEVEIENLMNSNEILNEEVNTLSDYIGKLEAEVDRLLAKKTKKK